MQAIRRSLPWLLILAAPAGMLYPLWSNPLSAGEDDVIYYHPLRAMVAESLRQGRWPVYNPREATGAPLMADPQSAVMFPASWLFVAMDAKRAYSLSIFLAFAAAGSGAYLYLRKLALVRPAATFGAIAFMFCGFMVGHRVHLAMIQTAAFLPWGLWCIETLRTRPWGALVCLVPVAFFAIAAGHWAILTYMGLLWLVYFLVRARPLIRSIGVVAASALLAAALAAPQLQATAELMGQATRRSIGFAEAGENSFLPAAGVLAVFPMLMGSRTPGFFPQRWWGPWHQCEMLGYVGLLTLVLAGAAVWRLYRRGAEQQTEQGHAADPTPDNGDRPASWGPQMTGVVPLSGLVKLWTWSAVAAGLWMLGYYLPPYWFVHLLPVLNMVRCPARMVLVVDMALATLAAISLHVVMAGVAERGPRADRLRRTIRRGVSVVLPAAMLASLAVLAAGASLLTEYRSRPIPWFAGTASDALAAIRPGNPAVWVPIALLLATAAAVHFWLGRPRQRASLLIVVLLADLFFVTRFVDVPPASSARADPASSPAAAWLRENGPKGEDFRVYGLADSYCRRPAELLLPKTGQSLGFSTLASYGPWHSAAHAHLLGFDHYGRNSDWAALVRRNYLLSLYGVRYVLAAEAQHRGVIESVRIPAGPGRPDGPNLLTDDWDLKAAEMRDGLLRLGSRIYWRASFAGQPVELATGEVYRIALDVRSPQGRAGSLIRAQVCRYWRAESEADEACLEIHTEQVGGDWRHFEWMFRAGPELSHQVTFVISTRGCPPVEIRNIRLCRSGWDAAVNPGGGLRPGEPVYRKVAELRALAAGGADVAVYENRLCRVPAAGQSPAATSSEIEALRWRRDWPQEAQLPAPPNIAVSASSDPGRLLAGWSFPAAMVYLCIAVSGAFLGRRRRKSNRARKTSGRVCS